MKHALRTSLIPTGTYFAFSIATLFIGATFMEIIFSFHGMGEYGVSTITRTRRPRRGGGGRRSAASASSSVRSSSDITVAILDPRVRLS